MRRAAHILVLAAVALWARPAAASLDGDFARAARMLREWQFDDARAAIARLVARAPKAAETRYLQAELAYLDGEYARAVELLDGLADKDVYGSVGQLRSLAKSTAEATDGFARYDSPGGHFAIYYEAGSKDEVIVELAAEVLERAYDVVGEDLGHRPTRVIRVELLGDQRDLAKVSTLTVKEIETTGTIALCKYGKLMVVTPRATYFGYPWMDTLVHEYVHYVVSEATRDNVPVWLHEGIARFEQTRWRLDAGVHLSPVEEALLARGLKSRRLISFDDMHPSMAKLPSQEAAGLAFAEVYTMIGYVHDTVGYDGLRRALASIRDGRSARRAIAEVMDAAWPKVERNWKSYLRKRKLSAAPGAVAHADRIRFKTGDDGDAGEDAENVGVDTVGDKARGHARLGGMLRARGMSAAAAVEYEKALAIDGDDAFVRGKLSRTYLELGRHDDAVRMAEPLLEADESDAGPATTLGIAYLALGRAEAARDAFLVALRVQPFDPAVRCGLADAYGQLGEPALALREKRACSMLGAK